MKNSQLILLFYFFASVCSFGQKNFESGYFIGNDNIKTECLINNKDWKNNPVNFYYKKGDLDSARLKDITQIKEFGILGKSKYIRATINIDRSTQVVNELTTNSQPEWSKEQLFLKVLIEGNRSLYYYEDKSVARFFYSVNDTSLKQLVHKQYIVKNVDLLNNYNQHCNNMAENNAFRQQLWVDVKCPSMSIKSAENIGYSKNELKKYFKEYNKCMGDTFVDFTKNATKSIFHLRFTPGITYSSYTFSYYPYTFSDYYYLNYSLGLEFEYILPFYNHYWSLLFEPTFNIMYTTGDSRNQIINFGFSPTLNKVDFPIGARRYLYKLTKTEIYINAFYNPSFLFNFIQPAAENTILNTSSFAIGAGFNYGAFSIEPLYYFRQNYNWTSDFAFKDHGRIELIIGIKLF
jgi:hypothetical protein